MRPPSASGTAGARPAMCGSAATTALRTPTTLRRSTASNSSVAHSSSRRGCDTPALAMSTSTRPPCAAATALSARAVAPASVTSQTCAV